MWHESNSKPWNLSSDMCTKPLGCFLGPQHTLGRHSSPYVRDTVHFQGNSALMLCMATWLYSTNSAARLAQQWCPSPLGWQPHARKPHVRTVTPLAFCHREDHAAPQGVLGAQIGRFEGDPGGAENPCCLDACKGLLFQLHSIHIGFWDPSPARQLLYVYGMDY
jgi:hypothetical protein